MRHVSRTALTRDGSIAVARLRNDETERHAAMVKALEFSLDRQQWFAILDASEGRPVA
jgi:predicted oxidoreductase